MTAFITGATSGFGEAIARMLDKNGYKVVILGRREQRFEKLVGEFKNAYPIVADVRDKEAIFGAINNLPEEFKDIEILINNAGLALGTDKLQDTTVEDLETVIDTNIKGLIYATKAILPIMIQKKSGYIFNIGSTAGKWPYPGSHVYGATKAFVKQFSFNLRNDLIGTNIRVTEIAPGMAKTEFSVVRFRGDEKKADGVYENTKFILPQDIATIIQNCINLPKHININSLEVMPVTQTWAGLAHERK